MRMNQVARGLSFLSVALCFMLIPSFVHSQHGQSWSYTGENGPDSWGTLDSNYALCSVGRSQSPIDIKDARKADLPALKFDYKTVPMNIVDNGHSIEVNYPPGSTLKVGDNTYTLRQFHFHHPSEERVNGRAFDMVAHFVHANAEGRLAVVAVLLKTGDANALIDSVWKNIPKEKEKAVTVFGATLNATDLLPTDHAYYRFSGSLTTPPCSEGVTWYVMKAAVPLSKAQVAAFAALYPLNARPIQPTNDRQILETR
jgi:carbonic anhydrase